MMEFRNGKKNIKIDMMHQTNYFRFCNIPDLSLKAIELPYAGNSLTMLIILPTSLTGIENLEKSLTSQEFKKVTNHLRKTRVSLYLPKFKMEFTLPLKSHLQTMGMTLPFDKIKADFSRMTTEHVYINGIFHKAFVDVNEKGTEASAATAVVSMSKRRVVTQSFQADHPFLFFIRDQVNDVILFAGRFYSP
jgi:serine protease inhibitor